MKGFWKKKRVLVTGATGFFGSHLCHRLLDEEALVVGLSKSKDNRLLELHGIEKKFPITVVDISDAGQVEAAFAKHLPEYCFHLAGIASPSLAKKNPGLAMAVNVDGSRNVFNACAKIGCIVVAASSGAVYGPHASVNDDSPVKPAEVYGQSKARMEEILRQLVLEKKLVGVIGRPTNLYGPMDSLDLPRFVPNNIKAALRNVPEENDPEYIRDFIFVEDVVDAFVRLAENAKALNGQAFVVSYGESHRGLDLAKAIKGLVEGKRVHFFPLSDKRMFSQRLRDETGWKTATSLEDGLRKTIAWYKSQKA